MAQVVSMLTIVQVFQVPNPTTDKLFSWESVKVRLSIVRAI